MIKYKFLVARGQIVVAKKFPLPLNTNKKCMVWMFLCSKIALLPPPIAESNCTCMSEVLFFPQITFWRYKAIWPRTWCRNRKLSAHDCTDHIKTLFSSNNYHETRRIDCSCCGGIITGRFVSLLIKKYQQDKKQDSCWQIASRFQFLICFSDR